MSKSSNPSEKPRPLTQAFKQHVRVIGYLSFSEWNSIESTESVEFVEKLFLVVLKIKNTKNSL